MIELSTNENGFINLNNNVINNEENDIKSNEENDIKNNEENDIKSNEMNDIKSNEEKELPNFYGTVFRTATNWLSSIPVDEFENRPIKYLEIGAHCGGNLVSFSQTYGSHPHSLLYAVDPWCEYDGYDEYKNKMNKIYNYYIANIKNYNIENKVTTIRDFSANAIKTFEDDYFDIIYIDGNHESEYVLEDAVLSFRKLKLNGYMVFDDNVWENVFKGIKSFIYSYEKYLKIINMNVKSQTFVQKIMNN